MGAFKGVWCLGISTGSLFLKQRVNKYKGVLGSLILIHCITERLQEGRAVRLRS